MRLGRKEKKTEVDYKALLFPKSNEWFAWEKVFKNRGEEKDQKV